MNISLSSTTQKLLEERMRKSGLSTADDAVRVALETLDEVENEDLDDDTLAAIEQGLAEAERGEGRVWEDVRQELVTKYLTK